MFAQEVLADLLAARISAEALTEGIAGLRVNSPVDVAGIGTPFDGTYSDDSRCRRLRWPW